MTITAIAKKLNVTTVTIYRHLKRAGVNIDELRDAKTGEVTAAGASIIASLFDTPDATDDVTPAPDEVQQVITPDATGGATGDAVTVAVLQAKLDAANDTILRLQEERDRLVKQLDAATAALRAEQDDRRHERLALMAGGDTSTTTSTDGSPDDHQHRHWWQWWRRT